MISHSAATAEATQVSVSSSARSPKKNTEPRSAGTRARITDSIIDGTSPLCRMCGDVERCSDASVPVFCPVVIKLNGLFKKNDRGFFSRNTVFPEFHKMYKINLGRAYVRA